MAKDAKTTAVPDAVQSAFDKAFPIEAPAAEEPKFGKVEARISALEAYIRENARTLGWPELK